MLFFSQIPLCCLNLLEFKVFFLCSTVFYLQLVFAHVETFPADFMLTEFQLCILGLSNKFRNLLPTWPALLHGPLNISITGPPHDTSTYSRSNISPPKKFMKTLQFSITVNFSQLLLLRLIKMRRRNF